MSKHIPLTRQFVSDWPQKTGVYLMMNTHKQVIYVGKAKQLKSRVQSYFSSPDSLKTKFLIQKVCHLKYILTNTEEEALLLEASLIKKHKPRYNIRLKDDKAYPYIRASLRDDFPRFYLERKVKKDGSLYFGPYSGGSVVRTIMKFLNETYRIRDCSNGFMKSRKTPCLTYHIGHCTAPCVKATTQKTYFRQMDQALDFLKGRETQVISDLKKQMKKLASKEHFEQALELKNRIDSIEQIWRIQKASVQGRTKDIDIISSYQEAENLLFYILHIRSGHIIGHRTHLEKIASEKVKNKDLEESFVSFAAQYYTDHLIPSEIILEKKLGVQKILESLLTKIKGDEVKVYFPKTKYEKEWIKKSQKNAKKHIVLQLEKDQNIREALFDIKKYLKLNKYPRLIECYDISHFQGKASYASQVVFEDGIKKNSNYRIYKMKEMNDDYQSMKEVLSRRFRHKEMEEPQLILIDGGKGQLKAALRVLKDMKESKVEVRSIAKDKPTLLEKKLKIKRLADLQDKFYLPERKNAVVIPKNKLAFKILIQLRDEAHRFALSRHRKKLSSLTVSSRLDSIKGIGEKRKMALLKKFGSIENIKKTGEKSLSQTAGINLQLAKKILSQLKK